MAGFSRSALSVMLVAMCVSMLIPTGLGDEEFEPLVSGQEIFPRCYGPLESINGCLSQIFNSKSKGQLGLVSPKCCKAFTKIDQGCWTIIFPFNPVFPARLKSYCATVKAASELNTPAPSYI